MNDSARILRRPRPPRPARTAAIFIAIAALALSAAACGSGPSPTSSGGSPTPGGSTTAPSALAYSSCVRAHGVPNFPDPAGDGQVPKTGAQRLGVSSAQLQAAQRTCRHLYPTTGGTLTASLLQCEETGACPHAMVRQVLAGMLSFARCMRSHGVPGWPDPTVDSEGRPGFNLLHAQGFNPDSSQIDAKLNECQHVMPGGAPVPLIRPALPG